MFKLKFNHWYAIPYYFINQINDDMITKINKFDFVGFSTEPKKIVKSSSMDIFSRFVATIWVDPDNYGKLMQGETCGVNRLYSDFKIPTLNTFLSNMIGFITASQPRKIDKVLSVKLFDKEEIRKNFMRINGRIDPSKIISEEDEDQNDEEDDDPMLPSTPDLLKDV